MKSREIACASILAALASLLTLSGASTILRMPPPFSYLVFDPSEIPSLIAYLLYGFKVSVLVAILHFIFLLFRGEFVPIGPLMKFLAVLSMIIGFHLFKRKTREFTRVLISSVFRALVMSIANFVLLVTLFKMVVMVVNPNFTVGLVIVLLVTAAYNIVHVVVFDYPIAKLIVYKLRGIRRKSV